MRNKENIDYKLQIESLCFDDEVKSNKINELKSQLQVVNLDKIEVEEKLTNYKVEIK